jgi:hypothetical protein
MIPWRSKRIRGLMMFGSLLLGLVFASVQTLISQTLHNNRPGVF